MLRNMLAAVAAFLFVHSSLCGSVVERFGFDGTIGSSVSSLSFDAPNGVAFGPDENGQSDGALILDGASYLRSSTFNDQTVFGSGFPLTNSVRVVFKVDDFEGINTIYSTYDSGFYDGYNLLQLVTEDETGVLQLGSRTTAGGHQGWGIEGPVLEAGRFYHVVVRWDQAAQTAALFVDGVKYDTITGAGIIPDSPYTDGGAVYVGASRFLGGIVHIMSGAISDLAFYDHAWSDQEVASDYANYLGTNDDCCDALQQRMDGIEANVAALQNTVSAMGDGLSAAVSAVEALSTEVSGLGTEIDDVVAVQDDLGVALASTATAVSALDERVEAIELALEQLAETDLEHVSALAELQSAIDAVAADLAAHEAQRKHGKSEKRGQSTKSKKSKKSRK